MGIYAERILPWMLDKGMGGNEAIETQRRKVVPLSAGRVLEVGMGSALNLPFYDPKRVDKVFGLEPSEGMLRRAAPRLANPPVAVEVIGLPGEEIPLEDDSVDTVLLTFTLCTIPDFATALEQMRRVLRPDGRLLFAEHGAAPEAPVRKWQDRLNPLWNRIGGGCNLNREIPHLIEKAGFAIRSIDTMYLPGAPRFMGFQYWGQATHA